jgi:hypothetical protein
VGKYTGASTACICHMEACHRLRRSSVSLLGNGNRYITWRSVNRIGVKTATGVDGLTSHLSLPTIFAGGQMSANKTTPRPKSFRNRTRDRNRTRLACLSCCPFQHPQHGAGLLQMVVDGLAIMKWPKLGEMDVGVRAAHLCPQPRRGGSVELQDSGYPQLSTGTFCFICSF